MMNLDKYICGRFYLVEYGKPNYSPTKFVTGCLTNWWNGKGISLITTDGLFYIDKSNIISIEPYNVKLTNAQQEIQDYIQKMGYDFNHRFDYESKTNDNEGED